MPRSLCGGFHGCRWEFQLKFRHCLVDIICRSFKQYDVSSDAGPTFRASGVQGSVVGCSVTEHGIWRAFPIGYSGTRFRCIRLCMLLFVNVLRHNHYSKAFFRP